MLIRFNMGNFLSFDGNQEFSMSPGNVKLLPNHLIEADKMKFLKYAAIYGANASGKSNFVKGIDIAKNIIVNGISNVNVTTKYCRFSNDNINKPTKFEFEIKLDDKYYAYGFKAYLYKKEIHSEWLYEINKNEEVMIFERIVSQNKFNCQLIPNADEKQKLDVYIDDINEQSNTLFISEMARKKFSKTSKLYLFTKISNWFSQKLQIIYPNTPIGGVQYLFNDDNTEISDLLNLFDTGITKFKLKTISVDEMKRDIPKFIFDDITEKMNEVITKNHSMLVNIHNNFFKINKDKKENICIKKVFFEHGNNDNVDFEYHEESDGTKRLIDLFMIIQQATKENDMIFIVDEIDRSLHPKLSKKLIELFFKVSENSKTQLITTTHESELLDLSLLRRDEIWFVEREKNYQSKLFSLDEFKTRYDTKVSKAYLEGRYGALPIFKNFDTFLENKNV